MLPNSMQDHIPVKNVRFMSMFVPIRGFNMQLNISRPGSMPNTDFGVEKIRPLVGIEDTWRNQFYRLTTIDQQFMLIKIPVLPDELQESFIHERKLFSDHDLSRVIRRFMKRKFFVE